MLYSRDQWLGQVNTGCLKDNSEGKVNKTSHTLAGTSPGNIKDKSPMAKKKKNTDDLRTVSLGTRPMRHRTLPLRQHLKNQREVGKEKRLSHKKPESLNQK